MKKYFYRLLFLSILTVASISLYGCSIKEDRSQPAKEAGAETSESGQEMDEMDAEELREILLNHSPLEPIGDIPIPEDNPMNPEVLELGRALFFDPRLSGNNQVSCATCHDPNLGYGDARPTFQTFDSGDGARNSPTVINSGYYKTNFWDGRAASLEEQALGPIENPNEMNQPLKELVLELQGIKGYQQQFNAAFT